MTEVLWCLETCPFPVVYVIGDSRSQHPSFDLCVVLVLRTCCVAVMLNRVGRSVIRNWCGQSVNSGKIKLQLPGVGGSRGGLGEI